MSWQLASFLILAGVLVAGFAWYERSRPSSQVVALVAVLAAFAVAGRVAFAAFPNVKPTTDIVIFAGYALGPAPGFAVGGFAGLVSNFWFGQGPWTPWQMAAWGLCGVLGAGLAVVRPRAGRLTFAVVCALAGIAYGALLNFSLMATYGGELSLRYFLTLEARAVPFDAAHAIGNATLALIAGPAIVRMLTRFRRRFEWRSPAVASLLLVLTLGVALPARAQGADLGATRAAIWLAGVQNDDGGWGAGPEKASSLEVTGWAMLGLEAAGRNPLDVSSEGHNPVGYLRAHAGDLNSPGALARTVLALEGAGLDPRSFGGRDLVSALAKRQRGNGSFEGWPGSTAFAVMALRAARATGGLDRAIAWLAKVQNGDGGWGDFPQSPSTPDGTAAVMEAMPDSEAAKHALAYLRKAQLPSGGFALGGNGAVNSQSTAWAAQGMLAVGADPGSASSGKSALDYLEARQDSDGHYRYSAASDQTPTWVTAQVLAAAAGQPYPVTPVEAQETPHPPRSSSTSGQGSTPAAPVAPTLPSVTGAAGIPTSPPSSGQGAGGIPPSGGVGKAPPGSSPAGGRATPTPPAGGTLPEPAAGSPSAAPPFETAGNPGPSPWAPIGAGLGAAAVALASVLFFGRRYGW